MDMILLGCCIKDDEKLMRNETLGYDIIGDTESSKHSESEGCGNSLWGPAIEDYWWQGKYQLLYYHDQQLLYLLSKAQSILYHSMTKFAPQMKLP
ncbi:unnamed protein product [Prunus armeniaca]